MMIKKFRCTSVPALYIFNAVNTCNAKKMGRHRRGTLVLKKVDWTVKYYGTEKYYDLTLEWERPKGMKLVYLTFNGVKLATIVSFVYANHNKLLKVIKKNKRK